MWRNAWVWGLSVGLAASVLGASLVLAQDTPPRLRGTLDQVNGNALAIKARNGTSSTVQLKGDAPVIAVEKGGDVGHQRQLVCRDHGNDAAGWHNQGR